MHGLGICMCGWPGPAGEPQGQGRGNSRAGRPLGGGGSGESPCHCGTPPRIRVRHLEGDTPSAVGDRESRAGGERGLGLHVLRAGVSASSGRGRKRKSAPQWPPQSQRRPGPSPATRPVRLGFGGSALRPRACPAAQRPAAPRLRAPSTPMGPQRPPLGAAAALLLGVLLRLVRGAGGRAPRGGAGPESFPPRHPARPLSRSAPPRPALALPAFALPPSRAFPSPALPVLPAAFSPSPLHPPSCP